MIARDRKGHCEAACHLTPVAIKYEHNEKALAKILPQCIEAGAENIELHAAVPDNAQILEEWKIVNEANPNNFNSMCLDRFHLSNFELKARVKAAKEIAGDRLIIQADGVPMSGGVDDFNTTLQAIACADIIEKMLAEDKKERIHAHLLISGGTNSFTAELAQKSGVQYAGLSLGTHARKIVNSQLTVDGFYDRNDTLLAAIEIAKDLVGKRVQAMAVH